MINRIIGLLLLLIFTPFFLIIATIIYWEDGMPIFYVQKRPGMNNRIFNFYKFRTMRNNTPEMATHLLENPEIYLLKFGKFIRKLSLDELPNVINVIKGEMVFIGPRPALFNQDDLIELRTKHGIHKLKPGITGWAQVNGRDNISIVQKVEYEKFYLDNKCLLLDVKIVLITIGQVIGKKGIAH